MKTDWTGESEQSGSWAFLGVGIATAFAAAFGTLAIFGSTFHVKLGDFEFTLNQGAAAALTAEEEPKPAAGTVSGAATKREQATAETLLINSRKAISEGLGEFSRPVTIRLVDSVDRPGQALNAKSYWSGAIRLQDGNPTLDLTRKSLETPEDIRFYLAHIRIRQRGNDLGCEAVRVGLAHFMRTDDGFDQTSWKYYRNLEALDLSQDLDQIKLKNDWKYRDAARGSCWAAMYYLSRTRSLEPGKLLSLKTSDLPDVAELKAEIAKLVDER